MDRIVLLLLILSSMQIERIRTEFDGRWRKRLFENSIENQRELKSSLDKRQRLARIKFEEHCEIKGKFRQRLCPNLHECLSRSEAHQFLPRSMNFNKRFFFSSIISKHDDFYEKNVDERRRKAFYLYEEYCESTDRLPRACPSIDRCQCMDDCNQ